MMQEPPRRVTRRDYNFDKEPNDQGFFYVWHTPTQTYVCVHTTYRAAFMCARYDECSKRGHSHV